MNKCRKYRLEVHEDERGALVAIGGTDFPVELSRIFYMFGTKPGVGRGSHAHRKCNQVLICVSGSCKVRLDDGIMQEVFILDRPDDGLYVPCDVWREMYDYSENAILLVVADKPYDEADYIRDYNEFLEYYHIV